MQQLQESGRQGDGVPGLHGQSGLAVFVDEVDPVVQARADHRPSAGHGFDLHNTEGLCGCNRR